MIDALGKAKAKIDEMKIPLTTVSVLTDLSVTDLSGIFTGQRVCGAVKELKISKAVQMLEDLARALAPIPINYTRGVILREVLNEMERGTLLPLIVRPDTNLADEVPEIALLLELSQKRLQMEETCQKG